jgi:hypothetical protein
VTTIFIHKDGQELGPFDQQEVRRHWANGVVAADDMAWYPGLDDWVPVKDLFGIPRTIDPGSSHIPKK